MKRWCVVPLQLLELFVSSMVHLGYGFYIFSSAVAGDLSQALPDWIFKPVDSKREDPIKSTSVDDLPPIVLVHGIFGFGKGRLGELSYFGGAEKKDDRVLVPDLGSITSIYDSGDPTMYYTYWRDQDSSLTISGHQHLSYFSSKRNLCWFMEPKLEEEIKNLHNLVGNAVVKDRHIVIGTGSSQLIQAAWYALADQMNEPNPVSIVSEAPYYSAYEEIVEFLQSRLFKWGGDAAGFSSGDGPYIEMVTSPNNPDGVIRGPAVKIDLDGGANKGKLVHDLAYYWPQFTAITSPADQDIMLFTTSKSTGHAGSRIGWAIVRDKEVAKKMVKFMEISTIGVSKESQLRVASLLHTISASCQSDEPGGPVNFFLHSKRVMAERWKRLKDSLDNNNLFSLAKYPIEHCNFTGELSEPRPGYAWVKCKEGVDCEELFMEHRIKMRSGKRFGSEKEYARVNMMCADEDFDRFMQRLPNVMIYGS